MPSISARTVILSVLLPVLFTGPAAAQEHSYAPSDIENGRGLYQANCLGCHGEDGLGVEGVDLPGGRFRRASSDEDLIGLIRSGIPETLMIPRPQLGYGDLRAIVAFLRTMQTNSGGSDSDREVAIGDAGRGEALFFGSAGCSTCHGVNGGGSRLYPDLAGIGSQRTVVSLEDAMLDPLKEVRRGQRLYRVTDHAGNNTIGLLLNQDSYSIQLLDEDEQLRGFAKVDIADSGFIPSPMPSVRDVLSPAQIADLVAYLVSLKGEDQ